MSDSNKLGHDPRHFNDGSLRAHWRIRFQAFLVVLVLLGLAIGAFVFFCSCATRSYVTVDSMPFNESELYVGSGWVDTVEWVTVGSKTFSDSTVFSFTSTSQFLITEAGGLEEWHRQVRVYGTFSRVVLCVEAEASAPVVFKVLKWYFLNDSTYVAACSDARVEWQRRFGEQAMRVDFMDSELKPANMQVFEFYRDSTWVR